MRKILLFIALTMTMAMTSFAQNRFNPNVGYNFFSNLYLGGSVQYSRDVFGATPHSNVGADIRITKQVYKHARLRAIVDINGFIANGFDRYGKAMLGGSLDFRPFYIFADYGINYNPSSGKGDWGLAGDAGIGLVFDIGRGIDMHLEGGIDRVNNGLLWQSNAFAKFGYTFSLGKVQDDVVREQLAETQPKLVAELTQENRQLRSEVQHNKVEMAQMDSTFSRYNRILSEMEQRLNACSGQLANIKQNGNKYGDPNVIEVIHFEYASSELIPTEEDRVADAAEIIMKDDYTYMVEGWSSANGNIYNNQLLSSARASAVLQALIDYGVPETRLVPVGNGQSDLDDSREQKVVIKREIR